MHFQVTIGWKWRTASYRYPRRPRSVAFPRTVDSRTILIRILNGSEKSSSPQVYSSRGWQPRISRGLILVRHFRHRRDDDRSAMKTYGRLRHVAKTTAKGSVNPTAQFLIYQSARACAQNLLMFLQTRWFSKLFNQSWYQRTKKKGENKQKEPTFLVSKFLQNPIKLWRNQRAHLPVFFRKELIGSDESLFAFSYLIGIDC